MDARKAAQVMARDCACMPLRQASRAMTRLYDEALRPCGLGATQLGVLIVLAHFGETGASVGALADALVTDRTTLTRTLKPLAMAKLLVIKPHPEDARARVVQITRAGARALNRAFPLWEQAQKQIADLAGRDHFQRARESAKDLTGKLRRRRERAG